MSTEAVPNTCPVRQVFLLRHCFIWLWYMLLLLRRSNTAAYKLIIYIHSLKYKEVVHTKKKAIPIGNSRFRYSVNTVIVKDGKTSHLIQPFTNVPDAQKYDRREAEEGTKVIRSFIFDRLTKQSVAKWK